MSAAGEGTLVIVKAPKWVGLGIWVRALSGLMVSSNDNREEVGINRITDGLGR